MHKRVFCVLSAFLLVGMMILLSFGLSSFADDSERSESRATPSSYATFPSPSLPDLVSRLGIDHLTVAVYNRPDGTETSEVYVGTYDVPVGGYRYSSQPLFVSSGIYSSLRVSSDYLYLGYNPNRLHASVSGAITLDFRVTTADSYRLVFGLDGIGVGIPTEYSHYDIDNDVYMYGDHISGAFSRWMSADDVWSSWYSIYTPRMDLLGSDYVWYRDLHTDHHVWDDTPYRGEYRFGWLWGLGSMSGTTGGYNFDDDEVFPSSLTPYCDEIFHLEWESILTPDDNYVSVLFAASDRYSGTDQIPAYHNLPLYYGAYGYTLAHWDHDLYVTIQPLTMSDVNGGILDGATAFFDVPLFGNVSLGVVLLSIIGILLVVVLLRLYAGG